MAKSLRSKRKQRLKAVRRELVEPIYDKKEAAKLAAQEAALAAPKLPVKPTPSAADASSSFADDNAMGLLSLSLSLAFASVIEFYCFVFVPLFVRHYVSI